MDEGLFHTLIDPIIRVIKQLPHMIMHFNDYLPAPVRGVLADLKNFAVNTLCMIVGKIPEGDKIIESARGIIGMYGISGILLVLFLVGMAKRVGKNVLRIIGFVLAVMICLSIARTVDWTQFSGMDFSQLLQTVTAQ